MPENYFTLQKSPLSLYFLIVIAQQCANMLHLSFLKFIIVITIIIIYSDLMENYFQLSLEHTRFALPPPHPPWTPPPTLPTFILVSPHNHCLWMAAEPSEPLCPHPWKQQPLQGPGRQIGAPRRDPGVWETSRRNRGGGGGGQASAPGGGPHNPTSQGHGTFLSS